MSKLRGNRSLESVIEKKCMSWRRVSFTLYRVSIENFHSVPALSCMLRDSHTGTLRSLQKPLRMSGMGKRQWRRRAESLQPAGRWVLSSHAGRQCDVWKCIQPCQPYTAVLAVLPVSRPTSEREARPLASTLPRGADALSNCFTNSGRGNAHTAACTLP